MSSTTSKPTSWPRCIRPSGKGLQIRIFKDRKPFYTETIESKSHSKADLRNAIKRRDWLEARIKVGLTIDIQESPLETFYTVAQDYLNTLETKERVRTEYRRILNNFWMPEYSEDLLGEITSPMIKRTLSAMSVSSKTKRNRLIPLSGVFQHGEIYPNPCSRIKLRKEQKAQIQRYAPKEREKLLKTLTGASRVYFALLFGCGLRPGEALALKWPDYDGNELEISKQITARKLEPTTKTSVRRSVFVPSWVRNILNKHDTRFAGGYIFLNTIGGPCLDTDPFNEDWKAAHTKTEIEYRIPYVCRHTRASELLSTGVEPVVAARQLGHSIEIFLRVYAEYIEEFTQDRDYAKLEGSNAPKIGRG